jgi:putative flavoprotein involved in K+ transport
MKDPFDLVIVGAGQAGLAMSRELVRRDLEHVVLERGRVGQTWRGRWDSFRLVTPNWSMQLPDQPYDGENPDAFDARDEIVGFLERYAARFEVPVQEA